MIKTIFLNDSVIENCENLSKILLSKSFPLSCLYLMSSGQKDFRIVVNNRLVFVRLSQTNYVVLNIVKKWFKN